MPSADAVVQSSPFNMRHGKRKKPMKNRTPLEGKRTEHTTSPRKGFGYLGVQSPGGRGKY